MDGLSSLTVTPALLSGLAIGLMLTVACSDEPGLEATPTPGLEAQPTSTVPAPEARVELLQEIVETINAYQGAGPGSFSGLDLITGSCGDPAAETGQPCLLLESSTISANEARVVVGASHTSALWEIELENDDGEWRITSVKDLSG